MYQIQSLFNSSQKTYSDLSEAEYDAYELLAENGDHLIYVIDSETGEIVIDFNEEEK